MAAKEDVWVIPAGGSDQFGDPLPSGEPIYVRGCTVLPRKSTESAQGGIVIVSGYEVLIKPPPRDLTVRASDSIIVRGEEQQIEGRPGLYTGKLLQFFTRAVGEAPNA